MKENFVYDRECWEMDGSFGAEPGQEISAEIYEQMLDCMPPLRLPRAKAEYALSVLGIPVHAGFLMGEPHSSDKDGKQLYLAFGMNDYGRSVNHKEPRYYYLGLSRAIEPTPDGLYYYFDCMNADLTGKYFAVSAFKDEADAISTAANFEATLYKIEYKGGEIVNISEIYDPFCAFDDCPEKVSEKS